MHAHSIFIAVCAINCLLASTVSTHKFASLIPRSKLNRSRYQLTVFDTEVLQQN